MKTTSFPFKNWTRKRVKSLNLFPSHVTNYKNPHDLYIDFWRGQITKSLKLHEFL